MVMAGGRVVDGRRELGEVIGDGLEVVAATVG